jgi:hypothetical protein
MKRLPFSIRQFELGIEFPSANDKGKSREFRGRIGVGLLNSLFVLLHGMILRGRCS